MKRIFLLVLSVFVILAFVACSKTENTDVAVLLELNDPLMTKENYSTSTLRLMPNFETRELNFKYDRKFPNRTEKTVEEDLSGEAKIGGDFFDRFEEVQEMLGDAKLAKVTAAECRTQLKTCEEDSGFAVSMDVSGKLAENYQICVCTKFDENEKDLNKMRQLYEDVSGLVNSDVY